MKMINGDLCGNINRKCKVYLNCNQENDLTQITSVSEPTTCSYEIIMESPLACNKPEENLSMNVYPFLDKSMQIKWDVLYSEFKSGFITEKVLT
jgi:hypothetical protein